MFPVWIGHLEVYILIERKEENRRRPLKLQSEFAKKVGHRRGEGRQEEREGLSCYFFWHHRWWAEEGTTRESESRVQDGSHLRPHNRYTGWDLLFDSSPRAIPLGKKCCNRAHLPGWGGKATALQSSASGVWAAGIPSHHAVCLPNFKDQGSHQRKEEETETKLTPSLPASAPLLYYKAPFAETLASSTLSPSDTCVCNSSGGGGGGILFSLGPRCASPSQVGAKP